MSKRRLVITAVVVEGRTHADVAAQYGLSRSWVTRLVGRYRVEGDTAFEPRSRCPQTSPTRVADVLNERIVNLRVDLDSRGLDAGPVTIQWHLNQAGHTVSVSTIRRRLIDAGLIEPAPKKRPKSSYIRFEADLPTRPGNPTSPTTASPTAPTPRSWSGSMTTPDSFCRSRCMTESRATSSSTPSTNAVLTRDFPPQS